MCAIGSSGDERVCKYVTDRMDIDASIEAVDTAMFDCWTDCRSGKIA